MAFGTPAESWLSQQSMFDLWQAEQRLPQPHVQRLTSSSGQHNNGIEPTP